MEISALKKKRQDISRTIGGDYKNASMIQDMQMMFLVRMTVPTSILLPAMAYGTEQRKVMANI